MLIARLGLDTREYEGGLNRADGFSQKWVHKQEKFFAKNFFHAFGAAAAIEAVKKIGEEAARISKESMKLGLGAQEFQALEFAAEKTGKPIEELAKHMDNLPIGVREAVSQFKSLNLAIQDADLEKLNDIMDRIGGAQTGVKARSVKAGIKLGDLAISLLRRTHPEIIAGGSIALSALSGGDVTENLINDLLGGDILGSNLVRENERKLKRKRIAKDIQDAAAAKVSAAAISPFHAEFFDALNKMGGFAQRGDTTISTPLERIAKATEATAENTRSGGSPY